MNKSKSLIFILIFILLTNCSFDDKTGIWGKGDNERKRLSKLEEEQKENTNLDKIFSSENTFTKEIVLQKEITLSKPKKNLNWEMPGLNHQNNLGNIYLPEVNNLFLKKKVGKNKLSISKKTTQPLVYKNRILLSDDKGSLIVLNKNGDIIWKKNVYQKLYKKIYKHLSFAIYQDNIYVADNIGFVYSLSLINGDLIWIKNHGVPLKSKIKINNDMIFLINQDNRIISLNVKNGSLSWDARSTSSFIKSQNNLSIALSKDGNIIASNTSGDLIKLNSINGQIIWSLNTSGSNLLHASDFFKSSDVVINNQQIFFSTKETFFSFDLESGFLNWENDASSIGTPIVDGKNIFFVTENGYFVIIDSYSGKVISSSFVLKILKKYSKKTKITGFIMGSGKIYSVTSNGYLIISSASSGKVESFIKIGKPITSNPIISDGKLYIYTEKSRIYGYD